MKIDANKIYRAEDILEAAGFKHVGTVYGCKHFALPDTTVNTQGFGPDVTEAPIIAIMGGK